MGGALPEGNRTLGRPRRRWVDNIRLDLGEVGWGDMDWICLARDRNRWTLVNSVLNLRVPQNAGKLSSGLTSGGLLSSAQLHIVSWLVRFLLIPLKILNEGELHLCITKTLLWPRNGGTIYCTLGHNKY
jgi:hypothetical protein